jgi:hypothetical protein
MAMRDNVSALLLRRWSWTCRRYATLRIIQKLRELLNTRDRDRFHLHEGLRGHLLSRASEVLSRIAKTTENGWLPLKIVVDLQRPADVGKTIDGDPRCHSMCGAASGIGREGCETSQRPLGNEWASKFPVPCSIATFSHVARDAKGPGLLSLSAYVQLWGYGSSNSGDSCSHH